MLGHDFASCTLFSFSLFFSSLVRSFVPPILDSRISYSRFSLALSLLLSCHSSPPSLPLSILLPLCPPFFCLLKPAIAARARICHARRSERNNRVSERDEKYYGQPGQETQRGKDRERDERVMDGSSECVSAGVEGMGLGTEKERCSIRE